MAQLDDLNTAITGIQDSLTQLGTDLTAAIADLKAKIAAGQDLSAPIAALTAIASQVGTLDAQAKAE